MKQYVNTLIIALSVVICGYLLAKGYQSRSTNQNAISVTGLGEENFTSDLIVWRGSFSSKEMELKAANHALNEEQRTIRNYLKSKGLKDDEIVFFLHAHAFFVKKNTLFHACDTHTQKNHLRRV